MSRTFLRGKQPTGTSEGGGKEFQRGRPGLEVKSEDKTRGHVRGCRGTCPRLQYSRSLRSGLARVGPRRETWLGPGAVQAFRLRAGRFGRLCAPWPLGVALYACLSLCAAGTRRDLLNRYKTFKQKQGPFPSSQETPGAPSRAGLGPEPQSAQISVHLTGERDSGPLGRFFLGYLRREHLGVG